MLLKPLKTKAVLLGLWLLSLPLFAQKPRISLLVFSKTVVFRHPSIDAGKKALSRMAGQEGFAVSFTEDATLFNEANLKNYNAVVFLNTTGDVLNSEQQNAFERYVQAGGGYVGIHAATDTEYDWPWYGKLAGAYLLDHPMPKNIQQGKFIVTLKNHWATKGMPDTFERIDEFYNFKAISPTINTLLTIDEKTYEGGKNGANHPMSWFQEYDGGRSFYTAMGHTDESFTEPLFLNHLWAGIQYAAGGEAPKSLDFSKVKTKRMPEENRFAKVVLEEKLDEPMELTVLPDSRVLLIERKGGLKLYSPKTGKLRQIATLPVSTNLFPKDGKTEGDEGGLLGITKDPNFSQNHWIYLYYSPEGQEAKNIVARYELRGDELVTSSRKIILEVATQRDISGHAGGSLTFDAKGNLYISTGDKINPQQSNGYSPSDERPGRAPFDAQTTSANTNDLRGKILRIHPEVDGSYTIPEGNLFPKGTDPSDRPKTRPEIYTMGHRNPFRISVDAKTGFLYWGDIGPDAALPNEDRGPAGQDEVGQARKAGNFGWPYFVGDNKPYRQYDFATGKSGPFYDPAAPLNKSVNNTGLTQLPPAQKAFIWYPYGESKEFPLVGAGGRSAMAGPIYYPDQFAQARRPFPDYYEGKLFIYEWMRGWLMAVTMDAAGNYQSMERVMPSHRFSNPIDMEFGPEGDLYMLEYGSGWFTQNDDARLVRIEYNGGNRKPQVAVASSKKGGAIPFKAQLSSAGTKDFDGDALAYVWTITPKAGGPSRIVREANPTVTFDKAGIYKATLTVTDAKGGSNSRSLDIKAGNEEPVLTFASKMGNQTFFFPGRAYAYEVKVQDKEDGSLAEGKIKPSQVAVTIDYLTEGYDLAAIAQGHRSADATAQVGKGLRLIEASDCKACHSVEKKSIGPAYQQVALKYKGDGGAAERLAKKVIAGGSGVWGEVAMSAHPQLSPADAEVMVGYILTLADTKPATPTLPVKGSYTMNVPKGDKGEGRYVVRAAYQDRGNGSIPPITAEKTLVLRSAKMPAGAADKIEKVMKYGPVIIGTINNAYMAFNQLDLTGITQIKFTALAPKTQLVTAGGFLEVRLDGPAGTLIGTTDFVTPADESAMKNGYPAVVAKLSAVTGFHDLYCVFKNEKAPAGMSLFVVADLEFQTNQSAIALEPDIPKGDAPATLSAQELEAYAGKYNTTGLPFVHIDISSRDGKLYIKVGDNTGELTPGATPDEFKGAPNSLIRFGRDADKKITTLTLEAQGFSFTGSRESAR